MATPSFPTTPPLVSDEVRQHLAHHAKIAYEAAGAGDVQLARSRTADALTIFWLADRRFAPALAFRKLPPQVNLTRAALLLSGSWAALESAVGPRAAGRQRRAALAMHRALGYLGGYEGGFVPPAPRA